MIRCDIHKGKLRLGNFIEPGRDAQPRKDEGFVLDHGNIGKKLSFIFAAFQRIARFGPKLVVLLSSNVQILIYSGEIQLEITLTIATFIKF